MWRVSTTWMFVIAGILVISGFALPLLMVSQIIPTILALEFVAGISQMVGIVLAIVASVIYVKEHRKD